MSSQCPEMDDTAGVASECNQRHQLCQPASVNYSLEVRVKGVCISAAEMTGWVPKALESPTD